MWRGHEWRSLFSLFPLTEKLTSSKRQSVLAVSRCDRTSPCSAPYFCVLADIFLPEECDLLPSQMARCASHNKMQETINTVIQRQFKLDILSVANVCWSSRAIRFASESAAANIITNRMPSPRIQRPRTLGCCSSLNQISSHPLDC